MDSARTASFPHSNIGNTRSIHWTINGWCAFLQHGRHASTEADPPHHTITTALPAGHPIHPSCGHGLESYLHFQDQYYLGCFLLLLRSSEDTCLYKWTIMRPLHWEKDYTLLVWVLKAAGPVPETALKESTQERTREISYHWWHPCQGGPKGSNVNPSLGWTRDATHLMNWFLYNEGKDFSAERRTQIILRALAYMSQHMEEWWFEWEWQPLWYMTYLTKVIKKAGGLTLTTMQKYTHWIKPGAPHHFSYCEGHGTSKGNAYHWWWRCPTVWVQTSKTTKGVFFFRGYFTHRGGRWPGPNHPTGGLSLSNRGRHQSLMEW